MGDKARFPGNLDPGAQEFRPTNPYCLNHLPLVSTPIYYTYPPCSPYISPVPERPFASVSQGAGNWGYTTPPVYFRPADAAEPLPLASLLPPPSSTPSRTLLLSLVPTDVSESTVRMELEMFGDVRAVQMQRVREGIVTVHFYDLRHAQAAVTEIQGQHMQQQCRLRRYFDGLSLAQCPSTLLPSSPLPTPAPGLVAGRAVWAQFIAPMKLDVPDGQNQGTIVIFNLDSEVSTNNLRSLFQSFGPVKELRETPLKRHQKFVEFYDTRDAAKALAQMNGKEINGKRMVIEFSRPGGHSKRFHKASQNSTNNFGNSSIYYLRRAPSLQLPALPHKISRFSSAIVPPHSSRRPSSGKKSIFSKVNPNDSGGDIKGINIGSVEASVANLSVSTTMGNESEECSNYNYYDNYRPPGRKNSKKSFTSSSSTSTSCSKQLQQQTSRRRPLKGSRQQSRDFDPRFLIDQSAIMESNCRDSRTTVMIKNIPNKYSQKLFLNVLDNHCIHCNELIAGADEQQHQPLSSYDFVYLPIDFINKCNVGYGFVNMTSPEATWRLYKAFHLQSWEVFNSRKICEVTYARLQGVEALKEHFKNSKFPCDAEEYMPVVFTPPRDGRRLTVPVPIFGRASRTPLLRSSPQAVSSEDAAAAALEEETADSDDANYCKQLDGEDLSEELIVEDINVVNLNGNNDDSAEELNGGGGLNEGYYADDDNEV